MARSRSLLFVPSHRERMVEKALALAADVLLFDLEDGVPPEEKANARGRLADILSRPRGGPRRYVRVNAVGTEWWEEDLRAVVAAGCEAVVLPKPNDADDVRALDRRLSDLEREARREHGSVRVVASVENGAAVLEAVAIARASGRVEALLFGPEDYARDLGMPPRRSGEALDLIYARSAIANAAAAARVAALDGVWPDVKDAAGFRRDATIGRQLGYAGKSLIHPDQIAPANEIFTPTDDEVAFARKAVAAFDEAAAEGRGVLAVDGVLVDAPVIDRARRTLEAAERG
ncbi:MAG TPA: CoA ester lyase [Candidatus Limnocylindria bacterium]|nr:CoA ester lyase [Candidatus Limnocylindria bacterium]